ncbi:MAG: aspartate aminotransferase family protein [Pseudomonadota bacterium]
MSESALMNCYPRLPIAFTHGKGIWLYDKTGKRYLDSFSGLAVTALGHAHPAVTAAITSQADKLMHISNQFVVSEQELLAEELCKLANLHQAFFCNSGAEANETAIKLSRLYGLKKNINVPQIIVTEKSYHGRTLATLSASGKRSLQVGYEPLVRGFIRVPYNDLKAIEKILKMRQDISSIIIEPILGNAGVVVPDQDYLPAIRQLCDQHEILLIVDEVQTGLCRTGTIFSYQSADILPDILTLAKSLGNGIPIAACLTKTQIADLFKPGKHGSTFGGNPLSCQVALAILKFIDKTNLTAHVNKISQLLMQSLKDSLQAIDEVTAIRGKGLMIGIELNQPCADLREAALQQQLLINVTAKNVIRLLPALTITEEEVDLLVKKLTTTLKNYFTTTITC